MSRARDECLAEEWLQRAGHTWAEYRDNPRLILKLALAAEKTPPSNIRSMAGRELLDLVMRSGTLRDSVQFEIEQIERRDRHPFWLRYELRTPKRLAGFETDCGPWETKAQIMSKRYLR